MQYASRALRELTREQVVSFLSRLNSLHDHGTPGKSNLSVPLPPTLNRTFMDILAFTAMKEHDNQCIICFPRRRSQHSRIRTICLFLLGSGSSGSDHLNVRGSGPWTFQEEPPAFLCLHWLDCNNALPPNHSESVLSESLASCSGQKHHPEVVSSNEDPSVLKYQQRVTPELSMPQHL